MKCRRTGFTWIEVLLIVGILITLALPVLRVMYYKQWREWELAKVQEWGIPLPVYYGVFLVFAILFVYLSIKRYFPRKKHEPQKYQLPDE